MSTTFWHQFAHKKHSSLILMPIVKGQSISYRNYPIDIASHSSFKLQNTKCMYTLLSMSKGVPKCSRHVRVDFEVQVSRLWSLIGRQNMFLSHACVHRDSIKLYLTISNWIVSSSLIFQAKINFPCFYYVHFELWNNFIKYSWFLFQFLQCWILLVYFKL